MRSSAWLVAVISCALAAALIVACGDDDDSEGRTSPVASPDATAPAAYVEVVFREVQCLENPWEQAWLRDHPGEQFPEDEAERRDIFEQYWRDEGLDLEAAQRQRYLAEDEVVCAACNCPTGYEWVVDVPADMVDEALAAGFERSSDQTEASPDPAAR